MDSFTQLKKTAYGGRGIFATKSIPANTLVHVCDSSYASVIYREFRKEVCAQCFAYAFDVGRNTWNVKFPSCGVWFCSEECKTRWLESAEEEICIQLEASFERTVKRMRKSRPVNNHPDSVLSMEHFTNFHDTLETIWRKAEILKSSKPVDLDNMELEVAYFASSVILQRYLEDNQHPHHKSWSEFLQLQDNELSNITLRPYLLGIHVRVFAFLRQALPLALQTYVMDSKTVRAVLARDPGNSFGLWQVPVTPESEMFGWGMYISAAYFNHSCKPNVGKRRVGRAMQFFTIKEVNEGDELCISYVEVDTERGERRHQLRDRWFFDCTCPRCQG